MDSVNNNLTSSPILGKHGREQNEQIDADKRPCVNNTRLPQKIIEAWKFHNEEHRQSIENYYNKQLSQIRNKIIPLTEDNLSEFLIKIGKIFAKSKLPLKVQTLEKIASHCNEQLQASLLLDDLEELWDHEGIVEIIENALPLMEGVTSNYNSLLAWSADLVVENKSTLEEINKKAIPLFEGLKNGAERYFILNVLYKINDDDDDNATRDDIIEKSKSILLECKNGWMIGNIIGGLENVDSSERADVVQKARSLFFDLDPDPAAHELCTENDFRYLFRVIEEIPASDRFDVVEKLLPFIQNESDISTRIAFCEILSSLPPSDRTPEVLSSIPLFLKNSNFLDLENESLDMYFYFIPEEVRANALKKAANIIIEKMPLGIRLGILYACSSTPVYFLNFPTSDDPKELADYFILIFLSFVPKNQRTTLNALVSHVKYLGHDSIDPALILTVLPLESRTSQAVDFLLCAIEADYKMKITFLFHMIAPEKWEKAIQIWKDKSQKSTEPLSQDLHWYELAFFECLSLVFKDEEIREASYKHIKELFESRTLPPLFKWILIEGLFSNGTAMENNNQDEDSLVFEEMGLNDQHELIQLAIHTGSLCDPKALKDRKNPYRLYNDIKQAIATEPMMRWETYVKIRNEWVSLNIQKFREKGTWSGYKVKDLPQGISTNTLKDLFRTLDNRTEKDNDDIRKETDDMCGKSYDDLKSNFLEKSFITGLLRTEVNPEEVISPSKFHLFAALRAILDQSDSIADGKKISPREEMLLKMSASVQNCTTGMRDGLANYYNLLPQKYQLGPQAQVGPISDAEKFVDASVQGALQAICSNVSLLLKLGGEEMMSQLAHATLYLKNRFHKQIGLKHQLTFDEHTGVLSDQLLDRKPRFVVTCFLDTCDPRFLIKRLIIDSEQAFKDRLFVGLMGLIGNVEGEEAYRRYCVFDDDTYEPLRLTKAGAVAILKATGYFVNE